MWSNLASFTHTKKQEKWWLNTVWIWDIIDGSPFNLNCHMIAFRILFVDVVAFLLYCVYCLLLQLRLLVWRVLLFLLIVRLLLLRVIVVALRLLQLLLLLLLLLLVLQVHLFLLLQLLKRMLYLTSKTRQRCIDGNDMLLRSTWNRTSRRSLISEW